MIEKVVKDMLSQGTTVTLMTLLNIAVVGVMITMIFAVFVGYGDIHTTVMLFLATGLLVSANW